MKPQNSALDRSARLVRAPKEREQIRTDCFAGTLWHMKKRTAFESRGEPRDHVINGVFEGIWRPGSTTRDPRADGLIALHLVDSEGHPARVCFVFDRSKGAIPARAREQ